MNKNTKIVILIILTILASIIAWQSLSTIFHLRLMDGSTFHWKSVIGSLIYPVIAFCIFLALTSITSVLVEKEWILLILFIVIGLPILLFFSFSTWILITILILAVGLIIYSLRIHHEEKERIKFSLSHTMKFGLGLVVTLLILSITMIYYSTISKNQEEQGKAAIDSAIEGSVDIINKILPARVRGYDPNMTLDEFLFRQMLTAANTLGGKVGEEVNNKKGEQPQGLIAQIQAEIKSGKIDINQLPPEIREIITREDLKPEDLAAVPLIRSLFQNQIDQSRDQLLKSVEVQANGNETISDVITKIVRKYAFQFLGPFEKYLVPIMAISLFFTLLAFNLVFQALIRLIALIIFKILILIKFVVIKIEKKDVQTVTL